ncbi:hypothetical protein CBOM_00793 [Ceraceosorus bombacis]|uniref:Uncharacterized protein n=1 Tax=Ceraceosorus bombacis TaxID=401625 RepID=A0A0N7L954_9BASI|nr:hypothetical protein CBOM_00793 [Ceraceosorus bombacis]
MRPVAFIDARFDDIQNGLSPVLSDLLSVSAAFSSPLFLFDGRALPMGTWQVSIGREMD